MYTMTKRKADKPDPRKIPVGFWKEAKVAAPVPVAVIAAEDDLVVKAVAKAKAKNAKKPTV